MAEWMDEWPGGAVREWIQDRDQDRTRQSMSHYRRHDICPHPTAVQYAGNGKRHGTRQEPPPKPA